MEFEASSSMNWEIQSLPERSWAVFRPTKEVYDEPGD
jgi:hypothetical protein